MFLELSKIVDGSARVEGRYPASVFPDDDEFRVAGEVALDLDVRQRGRHYGVQGTLRAPLELACGRCLEPLPWPVATRIDLVYVPEGEIRAEEHDREVSEGDFSSAAYKDDRIDLGQLMREQFLLALPMKPLCSPECRGLCPVCGANLNTTVCDCKPHWEDPRLAPLKTLLKNEPAG